jgi:hypothetical protein
MTKKIKFPSNGDYKKLFNKLQEDMDNNNITDDEFNIKLEFARNKIFNGEKPHDEIRTDFSYLKLPTEFSHNKHIRHEHNETVTNIQTHYDHFWTLWDCKSKKHARFKITMSLYMLNYMTQLMINCRSCAGWTSMRRDIPRNGRLYELGSDEQKNQSHLIKIILGKRTIKQDVPHERRQEAIDDKGTLATRADFGRDLNETAVPGTSSNIWCPFISSVVEYNNLDIKIRLCNAFWTDIFPEWPKWVHIYRNKYVNYKLTQTDADRLTKCDKVCRFCQLQR